MAALRVFTDGARIGSGVGGWGWFAEDGRMGSGREEATTNQRMEVLAVIEALESIQDGPITIVSDSAYVVNCFNEGWWKGWLLRDWVNSQRKPVANRDLWERLVCLVSARRDVTFEWVKGHSGVMGNERADELATKAARA